MSRIRDNIAQLAIAICAVTLITTLVLQRDADAGPPLPPQPYLGEIMWFAGTFAPAGWAECDGQLLPIAQNSALFSLLGTTYGGDGRTSFGLPDLRGRASLHEGQGPGLSNRPLGARAGQENVLLGISNMPAHTHDVRVRSGAGNSMDPEGRINSSSRDLEYTSQPDNAMMAPGANGMTGGGTAHDNMPPFLVMTACIAVVGQYPSK